MEQTIIINIQKKDVAINPIKKRRNNVHAIEWRRTDSQTTFQLYALTGQQIAVYFFFVFFFMNTGTFFSVIHHICKNVSSDNKAIQFRLTNKL